MALSSTIHSGSGIYLQQQIFHMKGDVDAVLLREAWEIMTKRHQVLRSSVHTNAEEGAVLRVWPKCEVDFRAVMQTTVPKKDQDNILRTILKEDHLKEFDLTTPPLVRIRLIKFQKMSCALLISHHHSVLDGASRQMLLSELFQAYRALNTGDPILLPDRPAYSEFGKWIENIDKSAHYRFWSRQSALKQAIGDIPGDIQVGNLGITRDVTSKIVRRVVPEAEFDEMKAQLDSYNISLPILLISAWCVLLCRYNDSDKVVFGLTRSGRREPKNEVSKVIGALVGTIPLAVDLTDIKQHEDLYQNIQSLIKQTRECEHTDLTELKQILDIPAEKSLFGTNLVINRNPYDLVTNDSDNQLKIEKTEIIGYPDVPIFLQIYTAPSLRIELCYDVGRYSANFAQRILQHYIIIMGKMCAGENADWRYLQFLDSREHNKIIKQWNATRTPYQHDKTIGQLFQTQVGVTPDSIAVECEGEHLTFSQLNQKTNRLANFLRESGTSPEIPVAVYLRRSLDLVVAALGVIKAGGAMAPLDPDYPKERVEFMLRDSGVSICLSSISLKQTLQAASCDVIFLDSEEQRYDTYSADNLPEKGSAESMAYIIYTSGSTGTPKGVVGLHRGVINRCSWMWQTYPFDENEVCCLIAKISFVDSVWSMFGPLLQGVRLVLIPEEVVKDPVQLIQFLSAKRITRLVIVPSLLRAILANTKNIAELLPDLKLWITSGERLSEELYFNFRSALPDCTLLNLYGSTEVSADVTACELTPSSRPTRITIGRPISNTQIYILDRNRNPVPVGIPGELHVGGDGLARGYFERPDLTSERFVPNPYIMEGANCLFKTGDVARYWEDGEIEFLGRLDSQVKLRGFRIEPGEIENVICEVEGVDSAVVILKDRNLDQQYLAAFYQTSRTTKTDPTSIRDVTRRKLPAYMVPATFTPLEKLPLTPSGKIDRLALPEATTETINSAALQEAPSTPKEKELAKIWQDALGLEIVSVNEDFINLGGDSLTAMRVIFRMTKLGLDEKICRGIFQGNTIRELAKHIEGSAEASASAPVDSGNTLFFENPMRTVATSVSLLRGLIVVLVVAAHWSYGLIARLPEQFGILQLILSPLFKMTIPGFAIVFGISLGYIYFPIYQTNPNQVIRMFRMGSAILLGAILLIVAIKIGQHLLHGDQITSTIFFNSFYSPLAYYLLALVTAPLWFRTIGFTRHHLIASAALALAMFISFQVAYEFLYNKELTGFIQFCKLMMVAKFNYFNMSVGAIGGLALGIHLKRNHNRVQLTATYASMGAILLVSGAVLSFYFGTSEAWLQTARKIALWMWVFYGGCICVLFAWLLMIVRNYAEIGKLAQTTIRWGEIFGRCALPIWVLHHLVIPIKDVLALVEVPETLALVIVLGLFFGASYMLINKLYKLHYGSSA